MNTWLRIFIVMLMTSLINGQNPIKDEKSKNLPKKMLARRREEHLSILKMIAQNPKYEHRFQLVLIGITKALDLINEHRIILKDEKMETVSESKLIVLENACLFMDFLVNFNDDIYLVLNKMSRNDPAKEWKELLKFSVDILDKNEDMLDAVTSKEFEFLKKNLDLILNEQRSPDYTYENSIKKLLEITEKSNQEDEEALKVTKKKKKLKKGPGLQGKIEL